MQRKDDIEFLNNFRDKIDRYLFVGYAPCVDPEAHEYDGEALDKMNAKLQTKEYGELRRAISEMIPRTKSLLAECGVTPIIENYPPPMVGGKVLRFHMLDLVTENCSEFRIPKSRILDVIDQAIGVLKRKGPEPSLKPYLAERAAAREMVSTPTSKKVFIVHGKDEDNKNALKNMLIRWVFDPIILAEQPNRGRVLIEKLLDHTSDIGFVFVLMTGDDVAAAKSDFQDFMADLSQVDTNVYVTTGMGQTRRLHSAESLVHRAKEIFKPRVRQNVIFEYGLCIGNLGRKNVCVLVRGEPLEIPSDVLGYGHIPFEKAVSECEEQIRRELEAAGYKPRKQ